MSEAHKEKISKALRGKTKSEEHRRNLSLSRKGKPQTPEHREAARKGFRKAWPNGRKHTAEAIEKIRQSKIGNQWNVGRKQSEEAIEKMRQSKMGNQWNVGRKPSEETLQKMRGMSAAPASHKCNISPEVLLDVT